MRQRFLDAIAQMTKREPRGATPMYGGAFTAFPSWEAACAGSTAYKTDFDAYRGIVERIQRGEHGCGRNLLPILAGVLLGGGKVLDFGGNLGMVYFDVLKHLGSRIDWWRVVDQPDVALYGNSNFADGKLSFFSSIDEALGGAFADVILCAHVIHYLPDPYETLKQLVSKRPNAIILHELPIAAGEIFFVQRFPSALGGGEFPARILSEKKLKDAIGPYDMIAEMDLKKWAPFDDVRHVARLYRRKATP